MLIEEGADVNNTSNAGATPLLIASHEGHEAVLRVLIELGADVNKAANERHDAAVHGR